MAVCILNYRKGIIVLVGKSYGSMSMLEKAAYSSLFFLAVSGDGVLADSLRQLKSTSGGSVDGFAIGMIIGGSVLVLGGLVGFIVLIYQCCTDHNQKAQVDLEGQVNQEGVPLLGNERNANIFHQCLVCCGQSMAIR